MERWIPAVKNSFLNRLQYPVKNPGEVNHEPVAMVNKDKSNKVMYIKARPGETVKLNASGSTDPDKDKINFRWFYYTTASDYRGDVAISNPTTTQQSIRLPEDIGDKKIHLVLEVQDSGMPALVTYKRVILSAK
jgi:hypothetical protein